MGAWIEGSGGGVSDRKGLVIFGCVLFSGFFWLWDFFPNRGDTVVVVFYTIGSLILLIGFQVSRCFCWSLLSKQVPTIAKGLQNVWMFVFYIAGRGAGSLIGDAFRTDRQSLPEVDYAKLGFTAWSPRNTYAWCLQLLCLFLTLFWALNFRFMVPCSRAS